MDRWTFHYTVDGLYVRPHGAYIIDPQGTRVAITRQYVGRYKTFLHSCPMQTSANSPIRDAIERGPHRGLYRHTVWHTCIVPVVANSIDMFHAVYHPTALPLWAWNHGEVLRKGYMENSILPLLQLDDPYLVASLPGSIYRDGGLRATAQRRSAHPNLRELRTHLQCCPDARRESHSAHTRARIAQISADVDFDIAGALARWRDHRPELQLQPHAWVPFATT